MRLAKWPSTTEVIKDFGLINDYLEAGSDLLNMHRAMKRGRLVTAGCHLLGFGKPLGDGWETRHPECQQYLDAYRKFQRDHELTVLQVEPELRNEIYHYISHPDQIVLLDGKGPVDLELKSGGMPSWCRLQTAGQVLAAGNPRMPRYGLQLKPDGTYTLYPHEDFRDLDRWIAMIETWWTIHDLRIAREGVRNGE